MNQPRTIVFALGFVLAGTAGVACVGQVGLGTLKGDAGTGSPGTGNPGSGPGGGELDAAPPTPEPDATPDVPIVDDAGCPILAANEELIDDMEGPGEPFIPKVQGRAGVWSDGTDTTPGATISPPVGSLFQVSDSGDPCHGHVARVSGGPFLLWGAEMSVSLGGPYDASAYTGISFWVKATPGAFINVEFPDKSSDPASGICSLNLSAANACYDNWTFGANLPSTWSKIVIPFSALTQGGWGSVAPQFDPSTLYEIQFTINPGAAFDISVDDVAFITQ